MSSEIYDQLVEFIGIEPENKGEKLFFDLMWEYMGEEYKEKVLSIEL